MEFMTLILLLRELWSLSAPSARHDAPGDMAESEVLSSQLAWEQLLLHWGDRFRPPPHCIPKMPHVQSKDTLLRASW